MLIKDWMATAVLTVDANTSVMRATRIMKENNIRRLPVLSQGKLAGVVTDRDLKEASPSSTSDMDIHEMYYLLSEMKIKDVMTDKCISMHLDDTLEKAALVMLAEKISGVMILDAKDNLVGLLSETDILRGFIHATGIQDGADQYVIDMPDAPGSVTRVIDTLREYNARVLSILTSFEDAPAGQKRVSIRISIDDDKLPALEQDIMNLDNYNIVSHNKDELQNLPSKK
ncbi:MAG: CBS and ACT domain-containing protein [Desulfobulbaceae bacterium]|nr:CBS and ACT domain-containing protein [Desulfobulbaceae bacterium]